MLFRSPQGKVLMTLGTPGVTGEDATHFNAPSDVLIAPNGDIFIADGHGDKTNARMVKFDKTGKFIKAWGKDRRFYLPIKRKLERMGYTVKLKNIGQNRWRDDGADCYRIHVI